MRTRSSATWRFPGGGEEDRRQAGGSCETRGWREWTHPRPFVPPVTTAVLPSRRKGVVVALISRAPRDDGEASAAENEKLGTVWTVGRRGPPTRPARQRRDADGKGVSSWMFFAESAPLPRHCLGTRRRRARPARAALRVVRPGDATAGRPSPREGVLARRLPIPPRPEKNFPKTRHLLASSSWPCPRARVRPACPRRSALRSSPTSVRLRNPEAVSSEPCSGSRPRTPTPPWCPTRRSAPSRSWGARRTPRISSATSTRRTDAPRPWTSPAPRATLQPQDPPRPRPPRERFHTRTAPRDRCSRWPAARRAARRPLRPRRIRSHPPPGRSSPIRARWRGGREGPPSGAVTHR